MKLSLGCTASAITTLCISVALAIPSPSSLYKRISFKDSGAIFKRQDTNSTIPLGGCGKFLSGIQKCATDISRCCSQMGYCGDSDEYCGQGCQAEFGICSNSTTSPNSTIISPGPSRPKLGKVPYAVRISNCTVPGTVAIAFDDGPFSYTSELLDIFDKYGAKATFFLNGQNWGGPITNEENGLADVIRRMYKKRHQIGSHTWSHANLDVLSADGIRTEMTKLETALVGIIGKIPTYMRPPYFNCGRTCSQVMEELGYHIIYTNLDTEDWANTTPDTIHKSVEIFNKTISSVPPHTGTFIPIAHDVFNTTVHFLAESMLQRIKALGYKAVTVGECLGDPRKNWYRDEAHSGFF